MNLRTSTLPLIASVLFLFPAPTVAQAERQLDAGTFVRKSLTFLPPAFGDCPEDERFQARADEHLRVGLLPALAPVARLRARAEAQFCADFRQAVIQGTAKDWSGLAGMERFDANPLPETLEQEAAARILQAPGRADTILRELLADTLMGLLRSQALARSLHLAADHHQQSLVAMKMKTQDVTEDELALLRDAGYLATLHFRGFDARTVSDTTWRGSARWEARLWSFQPDDSTFRLENTLGGTLEDVAKTGEQAGREVSGADRAVTISSAWLQLRAFRFTTQITSVEGWWLRPAGEFRANTEADILLHRRFRYIETRVGRDGAERETRVGYGYIDRTARGDSVFRLRHIGGSNPYHGLVLDEVPGTAWGHLGFSLNRAERIDVAEPAFDADDHRLRLRRVGQAFEVRLGGRGNLGGLVHNHVAFDLSGVFGGADGALERDLGRDLLIDTLPLRAAVPVTGFMGFGLDLGWEMRYLIRRLALTMGVQGGGRGILLTTGDERIRNSEGRDRTSAWRGRNGDDLPWAEHEIDRIFAIEGHVLLRAGAQISLSARHGLGAEVLWDPLAASSDWGVVRQNQEQDLDVGGNRLRFAPVRILVNWVFG